MSRRKWLGKRPDGTHAANAAVGAGRRIVPMDGQNGYIVGLMVGCQIGTLDGKVAEALVEAFTTFRESPAITAQLTLEAKYIVDAAYLEVK